MKLFSRLTAAQTFITGLVLCLLLAGAAFFWAVSLYQSLADFQSPLSQNALQPGPNLGLPATRKVVFILVDALRLDTSLQESAMPVLNQLRRQGASAVMHSRSPSLSQPGYATLLTGAWPALNGGPALNKEYASIASLPQDNIFTAAHRAGIKTAISGYNWFEKLVPQAAVDEHFYTIGEDQKADQDVLAAALPWLDQATGLVLIHLDQVDYAGHHEGGTRSPAWTAAAQRADQAIGAVLAKLDLSKDTLFICSDHGQIDAGGHGGTEEVVLTEPWVLVGAGVKPGRYADVQMVDVAPTLAALLGANLPAAAQGQVRLEMLDLPAPTAAALPAAVQAQQNRLLEAYSEAIGHPMELGETPGETVAATQQALEGAVNERLYLERLPRWLMVGFLLLLVVGVLTRLRPRPMAWVFGGALLSQVVFHGLYFLVSGRPYSLSWIPGVAGLLQEVGLLTAAGLAAGWLVAMLGLRASTKWGLSRGSVILMAFGYVLAVILLLLIPTGVHYAVNGALVTWTIPDMQIFYFGVLSLVQAGFSAVLGIALAGLSALLARKAGAPA